MDGPLCQDFLKGVILLPKLVKDWKSSNYRKQILTFGLIVGHLILTLQRWKEDFTCLVVNAKSEIRVFNSQGCSIALISLANYLFCMTMY